jgi:hypothetical protein
MARLETLLLDRPMVDATAIGRTFAPHSADVEAGRLRLFAKATGGTRMN